MAWGHYYINCDKLYDMDVTLPGPCVYYDLNIPPHGSIRQEWTTIGMKHGASRISFVEYRMEDDDIDGVWEAYGMKRDSEYSFTVKVEEPEPKMLFVYTLYQDGSLCEGFDIDTDKAQAILTFPRPWSITAEQLLSAAEKVRSAPRVQGAVEQIVKEDILGGAEDVLCLACFQR